MYQLHETQSSPEPKRLTGVGPEQTLTHLFKDESPNLVPHILEALQQYLTVLVSSPKKVSGQRSKHLREDYNA